MIINIIVISRSLPSSHITAVWTMYGGSRRHNILYHNKESQQQQQHENGSSSDSSSKNSSSTYSNAYTNNIKSSFCLPSLRVLRDIFGRWITCLHTLSSSPKINAETSNRVANLSWDLTMILQKIKKLCHAIVHCVKYAGLEILFKKNKFCSFRCVHTESV